MGADCIVSSDILNPSRLTAAKDFSSHGRLRTDHEQLWGLASPLGVESAYGPTLPAIEHSVNSQRSEDQAARIAEEVDLRLRGTLTDVDGMIRSPTPADIIVVTP